MVGKLPMIADVYQLGSTFNYLHIKLHIPIMVG